MKFASSDKVAVFEKKPQIAKGYYPAQLLEVKPRQKQDGTPVEGKFGKQIICLYQLYKKKEDGTVGEPVSVDLSGGGTKHLILARILNSEYKDNKPDGTVTYRSAFTPNSQATKDFMALGWSGPPAEVDTDAVVNSYVEVNVDDHEFTRKDEKGKEETYKGSVIKDVSKWEGATPSTSTPVKKTYSGVTIEKTVKDSDIQPALNIIDKVKKLYEQLNLQEVTMDGYQQALEQLRETNNKEVDQALEEIKKSEDSTK